MTAENVRKDIEETMAEVEAIVKAKVQKYSTAQLKRILFGEESVGKGWVATEFDIAIANELLRRARIMRGVEQ